jgi:hypothetical protein
MVARRDRFRFHEYKAKPPTDCVLNVAVSRDSNADGIQGIVTVIMVDVLRAVNPECKGIYPLG